MTRRPTLFLFALVALLASACGAETAATTTTSNAEATTGTVPPTTTTTLPPLAITDAPEGLTGAVESFYAYATGASTTPPPIPEPVLTSITQIEAETPLTGAASVATFAGQQIATVELGDDLFLAIDDGSGWRFVGGRWPSVGVPAYYGTTPKLVAVIGSDARPGQNMTTARGDSIHIVGLDGSGGSAVVGIPRDSYVPIPGYGTRKITNSLGYGGPDLMVETLHNLTGVEVDGYVVTGFSGFQEMIDGALGGLNVVIPIAIRDAASKASFEPGDQFLDGYDALAFARARKTVSGGDLTRSLHQGMILIGAANAVRAAGYGAIPRMMELSEQWMATNLSAEEVLNLSALLLASDLDNVPNVVAAGSAGSAGGASVVFLHESNGQLWEDLSDGRLGS